MLQLAIPIASDSIRNLEKGKNFVAVTFDDGFASTIEKVVPVLIDKSIPATFFIPTAYLGNEASWITDTERRKLVGPIISIDRLQLLSKDSYASIGSHGVNHQRLSSIKDDEAFLELVESKKILETITGTKITMHSFPFGEYDSRHVSMAKQAGYDFVFTIDPIVNYGKRETFVIGRTHVDPLDWQLEFRLKVLGAYRWQPFFSRLKHIIRR